MKCFGVGRFTNDPVLNSVNDTHYCQFSLAITERRRNRDKTTRHTNYHNFIVWDSAAKTIAAYARKGSLISFEATPRKDTWSKDANGQIVFRISDFELYHNQEDSNKEDVE